MITIAEAKRLVIRVEKDMSTLREEAGINIASHKRRKYSWNKLFKILERRGLNA